MITKVDTNGNKGLLAQAEFGYDAHTAGGDEGRVYVGTGTANVALATKEEANRPDVVTTLEVVADKLVYTNESGVAKEIDLSVYVDDTNLARLVGGTLDPVTGMATFMRDDDSTFVLDMSALLDDTRVVVVDGLISTDTAAALSANQGRLLNEKIAKLTTVVEW